VISHGEPLATYYPAASGGTLAALRSPAHRLSASSAFSRSRSVFPELLTNHDWNYAVFGPDKSPRAEVNQAICLSCHIPAASKDYVFTLDKIQDKAKQK
jgi:hypothetical protein